MTYLLIIVTNKITIFKLSNQFKIQNLSLNSEFIIKSANSYKLRQFFNFFQFQILCFVLRQNKF